MSYLGLLFTLLFAQNVVLYYVFGIDSVEGGGSVPGNILARNGLVLMITCSLSAAILRLVMVSILSPLGIGYLSTLAGMVILLIVCKAVESLGYRMGFSIDIQTLVANSVLFGTVLLSARLHYTIPESFVAGIAAGMGYMMAQYLLGCLLEQFRREWVPRVLQGVPILFISAGLMAMAFMAVDFSLLKRLFG